MGQKRPRDENVDRSTFKERRRDELLTHDDYTVGWVCALPKELTAATAMLDQRHPVLSKPANDSNAYTLGSIGEHNIVIVCLPKGMIGNVPAATVASSMVTTFPCIKLGLMVGIGGGVPSRTNKIRLGDVVVSTPIGVYPGVVKWDSGKINGIDKFDRTGSLNTPPKSLLTALTLLETQHDMEGSKIPQYLEELKAKSTKLAPKFLSTDSLQDVLFKSSYSHVEQPVVDDDQEDDEEYESCHFCDKTMIVKRKPRESRVHYGLIASGDKLVKDAAFRDQLNKEFGGHILCVEMEAAGLMNEFPCLVIRGICDYADSHKNKDWQEHAAIVAAAFAKELLQYVQASDIEKERPVKDVLKEVQSVLTELQDDVAQIHSKQTRREDIKILDWLTPVDYGLQQSEIINTREQGTGHWLIETQEFQTWLSTQGQTLFCRGIPGVGKTIQTSIVVDHLVSNFRHNSTIGIAYVYCNFRRVDEQTIHQLLASLLKGLAASLPDLPIEVKSLYTKHQQGRTRPSLQEILSALNLVAAKLSRVFVIIDALDEIGSSREDFLIELSRLQQQNHINLFSTSRHDTKITNESEGLFKNLTKLEIIAAPEDLQTYVRGNLKWLPSNIRNGTTLPQDIVSAIAGSVGGMFLLARIYLNLLSFKVSVTEIRHQLEAFQQYGKRRGIGKDVTPLADAYRQTMERINGQQPEHATLAKKVLLWIAYARRELRVIELQHALATGHQPGPIHDQDLPFVEKMVAVCAGLVNVDEKTNVIRLVHFTTQEYINQQPGELLPMTEQYITRTCVNYISFSSFRGSRTFGGGPWSGKIDFMKQLKSHPFYDYAARNWGHHARDSPISRQELESFVLETDFHTMNLQIFSGSLMDYHPSRRIESHDLESVKKLHVAVCFGLADLVEDLIRAGCEVDGRDSNGRTPLSHAAELGHERIVSLLVSEGVEMDSQVFGGFWHGATPLSYAARGGHEGITRILLDNGASLTVGRIYGVGPEISAPLSSAVLIGHEGIVRLLLDKVINIGFQDQCLRENLDGSMALLIAAQQGSERIARLLVERASNPDVRSEIGKTPLLIAAEKGHESVVRVLLDTRNVFVDFLDNDERTPLWHAASRGCVAIVRLLLIEGAEIDLGDRYMVSPLTIAANHGHPDVVQLLLEEEANPDGVSSGRHGSVETTPPASPELNDLSDQLYGQFDPFAKYRRDRAYFGRTPLSHMSEKGYESVVRLLLEKAADVESACEYGKREDRGRTPLSFAAEKGHENIVQLLVMNGANVNSKSDNAGLCGGRTPLSFAAEKGHEAVVRLLLEKDETASDSPNSKGRTPLSYAAQHGHEAVVRLLLGKAAAVHKRCLNDYLHEEPTPLEYAQIYGQDVIIRILIENGAIQQEHELERG